MMSYLYLYQILIMNFNHKNELLIDKGSRSETVIAKTFNMPLYICFHWQKIAESMVNKG